jgi:predicted dehydrogenase
MSAALSLLVVGCGSIGQRHIYNLRALGVADLRGFDTSAAQVEHVRKKHGVTGYATLEAALADRPTAVLVCTPPYLHLPVATDAIAAGAHVFVEKPIATTLEGVDALIAQARQAGRLLQVGYNLRFEPGLCRIKQMIDEGAIGRTYVIQAEFGQYLPAWRPSQNYRDNYIVSANTGGGIILDASHEIDYVRWLGGEVSKIYCTARRLGTLDMATEDTALVVMTMGDGVLGEVHMDCLQRVYTRRCKVVGSTGTLTWELKTGVRWFSVEAGTWQDFPVQGEVNDMYVEEMRDFLARLAAPEASASIDGREGRRVLELALAAKESSRCSCEVAV